MLNWIEGDDRPKREWDDLKNGYYAVRDHLLGEDDGLNISPLLTAVCGLLERAIETGRGWDEALVLAGAIAKEENNA